MNWIDDKYTNLMSYSLDRFKRSGDKYNFRCPICGDSQKSKHKARAWIFEKSGTAWYHCFNCGAHMSLKNFLKQTNMPLYLEYVKEQMSSTRDLENFFQEREKPVRVVNYEALSTLKNMNSLSDEHPAKAYVLSRKIPEKYFSEIFYAPKFVKWVNVAYPNKMREKAEDEPRLIIPLFNRDKKMIGFQGRSFKKNDPLKYITIMLDESEQKIFGMDRVDTNRTVYVFEGPIDSLFVDNSIASAGGSIHTQLKDVDINKNRIVIVYDNEPRNPDTVDKILKAINNGYRVCIWPETVREKDANDMILSGMASEELRATIDTNTFEGLSAKLKLATWKKV